MALGWLGSLRRAWASGSVTTGRRAQIVRRLHLVNLSRLRGLLVAVVGINVAVLALALVTRGLSREILGSGPLEMVLTLHRLVWIVLDLAALALLGRCLASPGPTSRLALVETGGTGRCPGEYGEHHRRRVLGVPSVRSGLGTDRRQYSPGRPGLPGRPAPLPAGGEGPRD